MCGERRGFLRMDDGAYICGQCGDELMRPFWRRYFLRLFWFAVAVTAVIIMLAVYVSGLWRQAEMNSKIPQSMKDAFPESDGWEHGEYTISRNTVTPMMSAFLRELKDEVASEEEAQQPAIEQAHNLLEGKR